MCKYSVSVSTMKASCSNNNYTACTVGLYFVYTTTRLTFESTKVQPVAESQWAAGVVTTPQFCHSFFFFLTSTVRVLAFHYSPIRILTASHASLHIIQDRFADVLLFEEHSSACLYIPFCVCMPPPSPPLNSTLPQKCKMIVNSKEELPVAMPFVQDEENSWKPFSGSAHRDQKPINFNISVTPTHAFTFL